VIIDDCTGHLPIGQHNAGWREALKGTLPRAKELARDNMTDVMVLWEDRVLAVVQYNLLADRDGNDFTTTTLIELRARF
jgi:hypothetical protein